MSAVHLNMVELEGYGQSRFQPAFAISTPHDHRIAELIGVLVDDVLSLFVIGKRFDLTTFALVIGEHLRQLL